MLKIENVFRAAGFELSPEQISRFEKFFSLLKKYSRELDLTRITKDEDIFTKIS